MTVSSQINYTSSSNHQIYPSIFAQNPEESNDRNLTRIGTSRLIQDSNGSIYIITKTPAEIIGEKVVHPIVHRISTFVTNILTIFHNSTFFDEVANHIRFMHFPSQEDLVSCLNRHPLTDDDSRQNGITEAVAEIFANRRMYGIDVKTEVPIAFANVDDSTSTSIRANLVEALYDCGRRSSAY
ncbi:MAG: hypothetical protein NTX49_03630 [Chlamydiae bacterium]|nr:hypothetical protein [Chlamydiota bacterium]